MRWLITVKQVKRERGSGKPRQLRWCLDVENELGILRSYVAFSVFEGGISIQKEALAEKDRIIDVLEKSEHQCDLQENSIVVQGKEAVLCIINWWNKSKEIEGEGQQITDWINEAENQIEKAQKEEQEQLRSIDKPMHQEATIKFEGLLESVQKEDMVEIDLTEHGEPDYSQHIKGKTFNGAGAVARITIVSRELLAVQGCGSFYTFNVKTGISRTIAKKHGEISSLTTLSETHIATGYSSGEIKIWDIVSNSCVRTLTGHPPIRKHPFRVISLAAFHDGHLASSASGDEAIKIWNVNTGQCVRTLTGAGSEVGAMIVLPDGRLVSASVAIGAGFRGPGAGHEDGAIKVWDIEAGKCVKAWPAYNFRNFEQFGHSRPGLYFLPDGRLASIEKNVALPSRQIKIWDIDTGQCVQTLKLSSRTLDGVMGSTILPRGRLASFGYSPDRFSARLPKGKDKIVKVWDIKIGLCVETLTGIESFHKIATLLDGRLFTVCDRAKFTIWEHPQKIDETLWQRLMEALRINSSILRINWATVSWTINVAFKDLIANLINRNQRLHEKQKDNPNYSLMHLVSEEGDLDTLQVLLSTPGFDANAVCSLGETTLYKAFVNNHMQVVKRLIEHGALPDYKLLYWVLNKEDIANLQLLLKISDTDVEHIYPAGETLLHIGAEKGFYNIVKFLIETYHANIEALTEEGKNPLQLADAADQRDVVNYLRAVQAQLELERTRREMEELRSSQKETRQEAKEQPFQSIPAPPTAEAYSATYTIPYEALTFGTELGSGSYGDVCRGTWQHSDVAIKKLKASRLAPATLESFKQEAEIMWGLRHDNIVQLYGVSVDNPGHYCLVMELMPQCSLFDVIHNGQPFEWKVRYSIASDIAKGLSLLHDRGVIHQDLKSPNVLIGDGMRAKITDFGLAQVKTETSTLAFTMPQRTQSTTEKVAKPAGTLRWMAPELFKRRAKATTQSDIHSYGMILWELVSRLIPFADAANDAILTQWLSAGEQETIPEDCPPSFAVLITKCWKERTERPTADEAVTDLEEIQQQEATKRPEYKIFSE
jgi:WD40 repeat protein